MTDDAAFDEFARYNQDKWDALSRAGVAYARPMLELDTAAALHLVDPDGVFAAHHVALEGADVLCLAAGGGQQSAAFALLGATVTVFDLSQEQLARDRQAAAHYGVHVDVVNGDMRDLSRFAGDAFDVVWHAHSLNFVPDVAQVHGQVARVLRPGGIYRLSWNNPFTHTVDEGSWTGEGYLLSYPYVDGRDVNELYPHWTVEGADGQVHKLEGPKEYVHTLSTVVNSLAGHGFVIVHAAEDTGEGVDPEPGSWDHFMQVAAPYLTLWTRYLPAATAG